MVELIKYYTINKYDEFQMIRCCILINDWRQGKAYYYICSEYMYGKYLDYLKGEFLNDKKHGIFDTYEMHGSFKYSTVYKYNKGVVLGIYKRKKEIKKYVKN